MCEIVIVQYFTIYKKYMNDNNNLLYLRLNVMNSEINVLTFYRFRYFNWDIFLQYGVNEIVIYFYFSTRKKYINLKC